MYLVASESPPLPRRRVKDMITEVAERHGYGYRDLMNRHGPRSIAAVRQEAYYVLWKELGWSVPRVARAFDRDPTTVAYGIGVHALKIGADAGWVTAFVQRRRARYAARKLAA